MRASNQRKLLHNIFYSYCYHLFYEKISQKDWSQQIVPDNWLDPVERTPITTLEWMREAELKHGRIAMLAFLGWIAVDAGLRIPGRGWESIPNSFVAHDAAVANGSRGYVDCR